MPRSKLVPKNCFTLCVKSKAVFVFLYLETNNDIINHLLQFLILVSQLNNGLSDDTNKKVEHFLSEN